jgi:hypothetical protein
MKKLEIRISRAVASAHHRGELLPVGQMYFMGDVRHRRVHPTEPGASGKRSIPLRRDRCRLHDH